MRPPLIVEDEHGELAHVAKDQDRFETLCGARFRVGGHWGSSIEVMTPTPRPPACLWCVKRSR